MQARIRGQNCIDKQILNKNTKGSLQSNLCELWFYFILPTHADKRTLTTWNVPSMRIVNYSTFNETTLTIREQKTHTTDNDNCRTTKKKLYIDGNSNLENLEREIWLRFSTVISRRSCKREEENGTFLFCVVPCVHAQKILSDAQTIWAAHKTA